MFQEFLEKAEAIERNAYDVDVTPSELRVDGFQRIVIPDREPIMVSDRRVFKNLCSKLGIPAEYMTALSEGNPELAANCLQDGFTRFAEEEDTKQIKLRVFQDNGISKLRGVVSPRYLPIPTPIILKALSEMEGEFVDRFADVSVHLSPYDLYISATDKKKPLETRAVGDLFGGLNIYNNEMGLGSFETMFRLFRLACLNGAVRPINTHGLGKSRKVHLGKTPGLVANFINDTIQNSASMVDEMVPMIERAVSTKVSPNEMIHGLRKESGIEKHRLPALFQSYEIERKAAVDCNGTLWGVVNGITRMARSCKSVSERDGFERLGGEVLGMTDKKIGDVCAVGRKYIDDTKENGRGLMNLILVSEN